MTKNWIAGAIGKPGSLHKMLGVAPGSKIPAKKLNAAANSSNPLERRRASLAKTLSKFHGKGGPKKPMMMDAEDMKDQGVDEATENLKKGKLPKIPKKH